MKKNKTIFLNKFQTKKKWEEMNHVFVDLEKNSSIVAVLYKRMLKNNINKTAADTP